MDIVIIIIIISYALLAAGALCWLSGMKKFNNDLKDKL